MTTKPDHTKLESAIDKILSSPEATDVLLSRMRTKDFHVMRGVTHMGVNNPDRRDGARMAIVLDTETTGLDPKADKVIQLAMIKVLYDDEGIVEITDEIFDQMEDPGAPLDPKITGLTGITDEHLKGQKIDRAAVSAFIDGVDLFIAHNAAFDRKFMENNFKECGFDNVNWACSISDVNWDSRVSGSAKLELLVLSRGYVYPSHNAQADIRATAFILNQAFEQETSVMNDILESLERPHVMVMATGLPFGSQEPLKAAGFKWSPDRNGPAGDKCWWMTVSTPQEAQDAAKAVKEAFGGDVMLPTRRFTPKTSYSDRLPPIVRNGFETKNPLKAIGADDLVKNLEEPGQSAFGF